MAQQSDRDFVIGTLNSDIFKTPNNPDISIVDSAGNEWKQISKCGYFRLCDEYFLAFRSSISSCCRFNGEKSISSYSRTIKTRKV